MKRFVITVLLLSICLYSYSNNNNNNNTVSGSSRLNFNFTTNELIGLGLHSAGGISMIVGASFLISGGALVSYFLSNSVATDWDAYGYPVGF